MEFFFPQIAQEIDWSRGYETLDKELQKVVRDSKSKRGYVDKLTKVWLKNNIEMWVLLHTEAQGQWEDKFNERMYIYQYRLFDKYKKKVATFVIFLDENPDWKPNEFNYELLGSKLSWKFSTVKLLEYKEKWEELEQNHNPFSIIVMAHLKLMEAKSNDQEKYKAKWYLIRKLYERGYEKKDVLELFRFLDWLIVLPEDLNNQLDNELEEYERSLSMPYITHIERRGIEQGLQQGLQQEVNLILKQINKKIGQVDESTKNRIKELDFIELENLGEALFDFNSEEDLKNWLEKK